MIKVGDKVKLVRLRQFKKELVDDVKGQIEVVEVLNWRKKKNNRYKIELHGVLTVQGTHVIKWVDESDITLDIEYYRNLKIENILK
jgi:hypothetical protein